MREGVLFDAHVVSSLLESILYRESDDDDASVLHSVMALFFSISALFLLASLLVWTIFSGVGILDFTNTLCWIKSPNRKYSWEYGHQTFSCFKYSFKYTFGSCFWKFTSLNLKEDNTFTSSFTYLALSIFHILMEKGKESKDPFSPWAMRQKHHWYRFDMLSLEVIFFPVWNKIANEEPWCYLSL